MYIFFWNNNFLHFFVKKFVRRFLWKQILSLVQADIINGLIKYYCMFYWKNLWLSDIFHLINVAKLRFFWKDTFHPGLFFQCVSFVRWRSVSYQSKQLRVTPRLLCVPLRNCCCDTEFHKVDAEVDCKNVILEQKYFRSSFSSNPYFEKAPLIAVQPLFHLPLFPYLLKIRE